MTQSEQQRAAAKFAQEWKDKGYEKGDCNKFWCDLLCNVYGIRNFSNYIEFEKTVKISNTNFVDAFIPSTKVLIEQKGIKINLDEKERQSDGAELTPYEQAKRYFDNQGLDKKPRWIIVCNFAEFRVYDMNENHPENSFQKILLEDLEKDYNRMLFLVDEHNSRIQKEEQLSKEAGELVGKLYDALKKQYVDPESKHDSDSLNALCVRLVFCLYAEDARLFGPKGTEFYDYMKSFKIENCRDGLAKLFKVLDMDGDERKVNGDYKYAKESLKAFPYVNGGLFADESVDIPPFTDEIIEILLEKCSAKFNWSEISPTIFGAVFESTLNPETRRNSGMHYTSIENIHKVIDPLFLNSLGIEFATIKKIPNTKERNSRMEQFQEKIAALTFLDPACGSGNFLTESYISLRRLENEIIKELYGKEKMFSFEERLIKVNLSQFHGIEVNSFAVSVAKSALWIAESQMAIETEKIIDHDIPFLPLKDFGNIAEGNALRLDWTTLKASANVGTLFDLENEAFSTPPHTNDNVPIESLQFDYIMGNPPFVGARLMSQKQKSDLLEVFGRNWANIGNMDYVCGWVRKGFALAKGSNTKCAFVSTNSITQGEQVANLWKPLFSDGLRIDFAYRTFRWDNESNSKAHVHCVIVEFSHKTAESEKKLIFHENGKSEIVKNINAYLIDSDDIFVESRQNPICNVPPIGIGNKPIDGGFYLFTEGEMNEFIKKEPKSAQYFKKWMGSQEFINGFYRYCLWLGDCSPKELHSMPECLKRVKEVQQFREKSTSAGTRKLAETPTRFHVENMPKSNYLLIPRVSSEKRKYIPIGFISPNTLSSDSVHIIPNASLYHFGVLTSNVHMAWVRTVCGRLKSDYRYSKDIVYNNFPWCDPTDEQKAKIEQTTQAILDARALYPDCSLADLYDELTMPKELRKAHQNNDRAVMQAYGFDVKTMTESECVGELMRIYQRMTGGK